MPLIPVLLGLTFGLKVCRARVRAGAHPRGRRHRAFRASSDPRVALHHFLIYWASADAAQWPSFTLRLAERQQTVFRIRIGRRERAMGGTGAPRAPGDGRPVIGPYVLGGMLLGHLAAPCQTSARMKTRRLTR